MHILLAPLLLFAFNCHLGLMQLSHRSVDTYNCLSDNVASNEWIFIFSKILCGSAFWLNIVWGAQKRWQFQWTKSELIWWMQSNIQTISLKRLLSVLSVCGVKLLCSRNDLFLRKRSDLFRRTTSLIISNVSQ